MLRNRPPPVPTMGTAAFLVPAVRGRPPRLAVSRRGCAGRANTRRLGRRGDRRQRAPCRARETARKKPPERTALKSGYAPVSRRSGRRRTVPCRCAGGTKSPACLRLRRIARQKARTTAWSVRGSVRRHPGATLPNRRRSAVSAIVCTDPAGTEAVHPQSDEVPVPGEPL